MVAKADYYGQKAKDVQQRERAIKAKRGVIYDRNGEILAGNKPVSTISVIHNQIKEPEKVITRLSELLDLDEQDIASLEEQLEQLEQDIVGAATDFVRLNELTAQKSELEAALEQKMDRWMYLEELAEELGLK